MVVVADVHVPDRICLEISIELSCKVIKAGNGERDETIFRECPPEAIYVSCDIDWENLAAEHGRRCIIIPEDRKKAFFRYGGRGLIEKLARMKKELAPAKAR